jgi:hypothetical protein
MAARRQTKKRRPKSKRTAGGKRKSVKTLSKKSSAKRQARTRKFRKNKVGGKKSTLGKRAGAQSAVGRTSRAGSGRQAGDLQGLSNVERADSESVDELLEEGNAFEGEAVMGVEQADDADEKEVRTHEVPEDDVPGEYLDKD